MDSWPVDRCFLFPSLQNIPKTCLPGASPSSRRFHWVEVPFPGISFLILPITRPRPNQHQSWQFCWCNPRAGWGEPCKLDTICMEIVGGCWFKERHTFKEWDRAGKLKKAKKLKTPENLLNFSLLFSTQQLSVQIPKYNLLSVRDVWVLCRRLGFWGL